MSDFTSGQNRLQNTITRIARFMNVDANDDAVTHVYHRFATDQQKQKAEGDNHITSLGGESQNHVEHLVEVLQNDTVLSAMLGPIKKVVDDLRDQRR
jgi:hypothetical protein